MLILGISAGITSIQEKFLLSPVVQEIWAYVDTEILKLSLLSAEVIK